ncbi:MAG: acetylornithine transaminase [Pseudomonadota bacterium]
MSNYLMNTYASLPVSFVRGEGAILWDEEEQQYLDALSGIAVCGLGHAHPAIADAICQQAKTLVHTSNLYQIPLQKQLAEKLCQLSSMDRVFFSNSGAEANEAAIKIARLYGHNKGFTQPVIITTHKSFHGRTLSTLSATGNPKIQVGFAPLVSGYVHVHYNDIDAIKKALDVNPQTVAIMVEPVQGEGGLHIPDKDYLSAIRELCDQHQLLMILDEIQTGLCRTGQWFAWQHQQAQPDIMTLAKALGNGLPIGACVAKGKAAEVFTPGTHGSTYAGNPLVCSAALATLATMQAEDLASRAAYLGTYFKQQFSQALADTPCVTNIRTHGLMIGIELDQGCAELVKQALDKGLLINVTADKVIRLLPPLIISDKQADEIITGVSELIKQFCLKNS